MAPLHYQDRPIGTLELSSPNPGDLGPVSLIKLREVLPLFSMAVRRSLDELEARVQAVIKEKCTAIHPSVEWRFRRAVLDSIEEHDGEATELEPIVFRDVHTLYAATDIRGSSVERNLATQADLGRRTSAWPSRWSRPPARLGRSRSSTRPATGSSGTRARSRRRSPRGTR